MSQIINKIRMVLNEEIGEDYVASFGNNYALAHNFRKELKKILAEQPTVQDFHIMGDKRFYIFFIVDKIEEADKIRVLAEKYKVPVRKIGE
jgi:hypothetical protein